MDGVEKLSHGVFPSVSHCLFTGSQLGLWGGQGKPVVPLGALSGYTRRPKTLCSQPSREDLHSWDLMSYLESLGAL